MEHPHRIFRFLAERLEAGEGAALVTIAAVTGASVRNAGAHMAVAANGAFAGSLSGGCIEAAVVGEARGAIVEEQPRLLHFGAGSPFVDIRLPCGGAVHLLVTPLTDRSWCEAVLSAFARREEVTLHLTRPDAAPLRLRHAPPLRMAVLGYGAATGALARLTLAMDTELALWSPDRVLCAEFPRHATGLKTPEDVLDLDADRWTAIAMLFHDHDWEAGLLRQLLAKPALHIGAMGSRATHAARIARLAEVGVPEAAIARIKSPIGVIPSSRDPDTLALSAFAEAVDAYNRTLPSRVLD